MDLLHSAEIGLLLPNIIEGKHKNSTFHLYSFFSSNIYYIKRDRRYWIWI